MKLCSPNYFSATACSVLVSISPLLALTSPDYDPEKNDLFTTQWSATGEVTRNTSENFVGAGYDWSGLLAFTGTDDAGYTSLGQRGFFSPVHVARAGHTSAISGSNPNVVTTMDNERFQFNTTTDGLNFRTGYNLGVLTNKGYDLAISSIGMHIAPDAGIAVYAVPDFADYLGREVFLTGHGGQFTDNSPRVMIQKLTSKTGHTDTAYFTSFSGTAFSQAQSEGGDSGNSIFLGHTDPAGNKQLLLLGVTSSRDVNNLINGYSIYGSTAGINASNGFMVQSGFAMKLVGESATSWTGAGSSDYGTGGNWTTGAPVAANYVTFDSAESAAETVNLGGTEKEMRGLVFNPGAAGEGFTFENGTLLIGRGGMANYSTDTQTFAMGMRLTDHQVWDATYGDYVVQGGINLNNKLLVVQGDHDTVIEGVVSNTVQQRVGPDLGGGGETVTVSGTGPGLTKYGLGKLTLKSAATYGGTTWLYGGTLALEENGALPVNTALVMGNNDTSRLEMNGKTLTLTRLVTSESITGGQGTIDLGEGGKISLYKSVNSGQDVFGARITGGTAGTVALEIGGWQSSASISNSFWLTGASDYEGQTILKGQAGGEGSGNGLVMRIANTQALGASGVGNETIIQYTEASKPFVRFVASGTYREDIILDVAASSSNTVGFEAAGQTLTFDGDIVVSRNIQTTGNQRIDLAAYGDTTVNFGDIRGQLAMSGTAATGSNASTLWMWANDAESVVNLNGEISDGTIKGAGTRGLAMDYRGAGNIYINNENSYTGATAVRSTVTANVDALSGQAGAFGNATTAVTIGGVNTSGYGQAIYAGDGVQIGRNITVSSSHTGALALGVRDNAEALFSGTVALNRQADLNAGAGSEVTFSGPIQHAGGTSAITKTGAGTVILSGSNNYTGGTTVSAGTLRAKNNYALGSMGAVSVNAGTLLIDAGVTVANTSLAVNGGSLINHGVVNGLDFVSGSLGGRGTYNVAVSFNNAATDILAPGASVGVTSFGVTQEWVGLNYQWEVQDFAQGAAAGTGYDSVAITGWLTLGGSAYILEIRSLDSLGGAGGVANYELGERQWTILTASAGITGFDESAWTINAEAFEAYQPGGQFSLAQAGNTLVLSYSPVPEPSAGALVVVGAFVVVFCRRQSWRNLMRSEETLTK